MPEVHTAAIALGSNLPSGLGEPCDNVLAAVERLRSLGEVVAVSSLLVTEPEIYLAQPQFVNAAALLRTELGPEELLHSLLAIELEMGRVRAGVPPKGPRVIDLDLIFYDAVLLQTAELTLPHPAMVERGFVLQPLAEIAPDWVHPGAGISVREMLNRFQVPPPVLRS